ARLAGVAGVSISSSATFAGIVLATSITQLGSLACTNGLTLQGGEIHLAKPSLPNNLLFFGTEVLGGSGTIFFDTPLGNGAIASDALTIGPGVTVRTGTGSGGIISQYAGIENQGTISARGIGQGISINGLLTNEGLIEAR